MVTGGALRLKSQVCCWSQLVRALAFLLCKIFLLTLFPFHWFVFENLLFERKEFFDLCTIRMDNWVLGIQDGLG